LGFVAQELAEKPELAKAEVQIFAKRLSYKTDEYFLYWVKALLVHLLVEVAQRMAMKTWTQCSALERAMVEDL
jgi:hypothetical protein